MHAGREKSFRVGQSYRLKTVQYLRMIDKGYAKCEIMYQKRMNGNGNIKQIKGKSKCFDE